VIVSPSASYTFTAEANRNLVANFAPSTPILEIGAATAVHNLGKVEVTLEIMNRGGALAEEVTIDRKKGATLDAKAAKEHPPIVLGNVAPFGSTTTILTFSGVKTGTRTLEVSLTYTGGSTTLSAQVVVP